MTNDDGAGKVRCVDIAPAMPWRAVARHSRNQKAFKRKDAKTLAPFQDSRQHLPRKARRSQRTESPGGEFLKRRNALVLATRESTQESVGGDFLEGRNSAVLAA